MTRFESRLESMEKKMGTLEKGVELLNGRLDGIEALLRELIREEGVVQEETPTFGVVPKAPDCRTGADTCERGAFRLSKR
ncbi:hypothetical protein OROHE_023787 [Orobanche hederae]